MSSVITTKMIIVQPITFNNYKSTLRVQTSAKHVISLHIVVYIVGIVSSEVGWSMTGVNPVLIKKGRVPNELSRDSC